MDATGKGGYFVVDIAIVGKGPAGLSCAMTARMRGLSALVIGPEKDQSLLRRTERIDNYPGMPQVSGQALLEQCTRQAQDMGMELHNGLVRQIMPNGKGFMLLVGNDVLESKAVVLAMGAGRAAVISGEEELVGRGVSYCATCDGMLYKGKEVAVLSTSHQGVEEAQFLAGLASGVDYFPLKTHSMTALPAAVRQRQEKPKRILPGEGGLVLETSHGQHVYSGIFIFREAMPLTQLLAELETRDGAIGVNRQMHTNVPGVFAAGDCTGKPLQIAKAVGEGNIAALSAAEYIQAHG